MGSQFIVPDLTRIGCEDLTWLMVVCTDILFIPGPLSLQCKDSTTNSTLAALALQGPCPLLLDMPITLFGKVSDQHINS